jgi:hypothetical protein
MDKLIRNRKVFQDKENDYKNGNKKSYHSKSKDI